MKQLAFTLIILQLAWISYAQSGTSKVSVDKREIQIGEPIKVTIESEYDPTKYKVQVPALNDTFSTFEVLEKKLDTIEGRNANRYIHQYIISSYEPGTWCIPTQTFEVQPLDGGQIKVESYDSIPIVVKTIAVDTTQPFKPIFDIQEAKMPTEILILYIAGGILGLLLLVFLIWYAIKLLKDKNKKPEAKKPKEWLPPYEKAIKELRQAQEIKLYLSGNIKQHHTVLTDTIRTYLEEEFGLDCFEKTTSELLTLLKKHKVLKAIIPNFKEVFEMADMVKFAKSNPSEEEHELSTTKAIEIVEVARKIYVKQQTIQENSKK